MSHIAAKKVSNVRSKASYDNSGLFAGTIRKRLVTIKTKRNVPQISGIKTRAEKVWDVSDSSLSVRHTLKAPAQTVNGNNSHPIAKTMPSLGVFMTFLTR